MRFNFFSLIAVLALLVVSCGGTLSQHAIDSAKEALKAAKNAEADRYIPDKFNTAKILFDAALAEADKQKEKMFSDYSKARKLFLSARDAANEAKSAVVTKKEEVKQETENLLAKISNKLQETNRLWRKFATDKEADSALKLVKNDIQATEGSISEVKVLLKAGDYFDARIKAKAIMSKLSSYQTEIQRH